MSDNLSREETELLTIAVKTLQDVESMYIPNGSASLNLAISIIEKVINGN